ncbi:RES family NAD+ phosphorylase [Longimicrobium sp.]|jgi:RES domain-containing protein|uniref:RES family NAD+ phosphorylase n=1 Tax=Longimicrobium sp. TaxID=2029185 RepID=UPI002ED9B36F
MILWRLTRAAYSKLDGEGARLHGGRWNSEGVPVVYLSSNLSLAALEYLVHIDIEDAPTDLVALKVEVPDTAPAEEIETETLPDDWFNVADHPTCVELGDSWVERGDSLLLRVPSALIRVESNVLLNPRHADAGNVRVLSSTPFAFDPRLLG